MSKAPVSHKAAVIVPREDVCRQDTSYDIPQMWDIVDIWESRGDEDVSLARLGKDLLVLLASQSSGHGQVRLSSAVLCVCSSQGNGAAKRV